MLVRSGPSGKSSANYNTDNLLAWVILGRSTLEYAAVRCYFVRRINKLMLKGPQFYAGHIQRFEDLMLRYAHGTKFNWSDLVAGNIEGLKNKIDTSGATKAVHVNDGFRELVRRDERYKDVEIAYSMLSDFAHPNMASHATVIEMPTSVEEMHNCVFAAQPGRLRAEFVMVVSLPWISLAVGTVVELLAEISPLLQTWLTYIDEGTTIAIDFNK